MSDICARPYPGEYSPPVICRLLVDHDGQHSTAPPMYAPSGLDEFARGFQYRDLNVDDLHDPVWVGDEE
jgi:hypothetical protein